MAVGHGAGRHACLLLVAASVVLAGSVSRGHAQELGVGGVGAPAGDVGGAPAEGGTPGGAPAKPGQPGGGAQGAGGAAGTYTPGPGWIINLGVTVSEAWTDYANTKFTGSPNPPGTLRLQQLPDFITQISPSITIHGDTPRVTMDLFYAPTATIYAQNSHLSGFGQNLNARAHAMIVEDVFYVDASAYAALMPTLGGQALTGGLGGNNGLPGTDLTNRRQSLSQVYSFSVTPYAIQRFGGWGTAKIGVSARMTAAGGANFTNAAGGTTTQTANNTETLQETAEFTSGENLGRFQSRTVVSGQQSGGSGITRNSSDYVAQTTLSYALTRWAAVFGTLGYETITYSSATTPFRSNDVTWSTGAKFTFGEDGYATIGYGHRYGVNSVSFEGAYSLTAKTRITGRYWTGFGTELQLLQADLATAGIDMYGANVNLDTGAPIFLGAAGGGGGNQNLYRTQNFNATLSSIIVDDPVSIGVQFTDQTVVATAGTITAFPSRSVSANASWQHAFSDLMTGGVSVTYGMRDVQGFGTTNAPISGTERYLGTSAVLSYTFSPSLVGSARYTYYDQSSTVQFRSYTQNLVMISLSKQF